MNRGEFNTWQRRHQALFPNLTAWLEQQPEPRVILDAWAKRVRWGERQQELYRRTLRDGDGLLVMCPGDDGFPTGLFEFDEGFKLAARVAHGQRGVLAEFVVHHFATCGSDGFFF